MTSSSSSLPSLQFLHEISLKDLNTTDSPFILDLDISCDVSQFAIASAGLQNIISLYDTSTGGCVIPALAGHTDVINSLAFSLTSPSYLISASEDHTVSLYDCRASTQPIGNIVFDTEVYSASIGLSDTLIAVASGSAVIFFDARNPSAPLGKYEDCHSDTVLKVKFHPIMSNILHSGGEDGLICSFNTGAAAEEDAVMSICNTDCPVRQFGFFGDGLEGMYNLSTIETAMCWHFPSSQRVGVFSSIREDFNVDYLVDCWGSALDPNQLFMAVGSHSGEIKICSVDPSGLTSLWVAPSADASRSYSRGHSDTVRCCKKFENARNGLDILITAGEDSKICMWQVGANSETPDATGDDTTTGIGSQRVGERIEKNVNELHDDAEDRTDAKRIRRN